MEQMRRNMDRMVEKAARHQEKFEAKMEREQGRVEKLERRRQRAAGHVDEAQAAEAVSGSEETMEPDLDLDEERLSILRMVEQGQIAPEEAEMLLDALQP
jgi:hypothetical protein